MKKTFIKKLLLIVLLLIMLFCISSITVNADQFDPNGFEGKDNPLTKATNNITGTVIGVVRVVCVTSAIIMLLVISAKYMISSPGDRADITKHALSYVLGAMILFGSSAILGIIIDVANQIK